MRPLSVTEAPLLLYFIDAVSTPFVLDAAPSLALSTRWLSVLRAP